MNKDLKSIISAYVEKTSNLGAAVADEDLNITYHNKGFNRLVGETDDLTGSRLLDFISPKSSGLFKSIPKKPLLKRIFYVEKSPVDNRKTLSCDVFYKEGKWHIFSVFDPHTYEEIMMKMSRLDNEMAVMNRELNRKNALLERRERMLSDMVENLPAGAVYSTKKGITLNKAAEEITGYRRTELPTEQDWFNKLFGGMSEEMRKTYEEDRIAGFPEPRTIEITTKSGEDRAVVFSAYESDKGVVWILHDVTQQKEAKEKLKNINRELDNFAYRVSHDLKSPLNMIPKLVDLAQKKPEKKDRFLELIKQRAGQLVDFINRILQLSRAGKVIKEKRATDLARMFRQELRTVDADEVEVELNIEEDLPLVNVDGSSFRNVVTNLLENSIKYRDPDKDILKLEIFHKMSKGKIHIHFKDNGMGVSEEDIDKIFNSAFTKRKGKGEGTGFGLAITKKIVNAHGGKIRVKSGGERKGAEFIITLPKGSE